MEEVSAYPDVSGVREVSADGLEGQGVAYYVSQAYHLDWHYPDDYEISLRMDKDYGASPEDPTDTFLIPLLQRITTTVHAAASGPPQGETVYPPRPTTPPATPTP